MRLIGMLSFFDEDPELISHAIECVTEIGVDYLIAADGPYDLFEHDVDHSSGECKTAILDATIGMQGCSLLSKQWSGNEVEKRNFMLDYAFECVVQSSDDWLLVFDADHLWGTIDVIGPSLKTTLAATQHDFAEVLFADGLNLDGSPAFYRARLLQRAVPGMRYDGSHWLVRHPDGATCATLPNAALSTDAPVETLDRFYVMHMAQARDQARRGAQADYYNKRHRGAVEKNSRHEYGGL